MRLSRNRKRQLYTALFFGGLALILVLNISRLLSPPTIASGQGHSPVVIGEFVAAGRQSLLADEDGHYDDWIELHNRGSRTINLLGWSLTDDPADPNKWMLPNVDLPSDGYLVVYASGKDRPVSTGSPKDIPPERTTPPPYLHTNFKLTAEGGYLALYDNTSRRLMDVNAITYPRQIETMAYGSCDKAGGLCYLANPTPGGPNDERVAWQGIVAPVTASVTHGFYDAPFDLQLATETPGALIRFTRDSSEPSESNGETYGGPISVEGTTVVRAAAFLPDFLSSQLSTFSYIFPVDVQEQPDNPPGYPATWGTYRDNLVGYTTGAPVAANYAMDPEVVDDPRYHDRIYDSLLSLPSLSLVTGVDNLDIYFTDPLARGVESERPVSAEWLDPTHPASGFQVDAGLRIQGHIGRSELVPKHSFRLLFKQVYGAGTLEYDLFPGSPVDEFDTLVLRAGNNESYGGHPGTKSRLATYAKDEWLRRTQLATTGIAARGRFVHLYLNGLYWGLYNLVERPDAAFAAAYFGGDKDEWYAAKPGGADAGMMCRLNSMRRLAELSGMVEPERYERMAQFVDPIKFSDYLLTHWYAGVRDWPENNWYLGMQQASDQFLFFAWDGELSWQHGAELQLGVDAKLDRAFPNVVKRIFQPLILNPDFRMTLADRLAKQTSPGGALSDAEAEARWTAITGELEEAIIAESARWGDSLYDDPITQEEWLRGRDLVLGQMEGNAASLIAQARAAGYYPEIDPPAFSQPATTFDDTMTLTMDAAQGDIYVTLDGSDPRVQVTGEIGPQAIKVTGPIDITTTTRVRARAREGTVWSALNEADYVKASEPSGLRITQMMYNPTGGDDYEFLELTNVGGLDVDLSSAVFEGIDLRFDRRARLAAGATIVLVANVAAFQQLYPNVPVSAQYGGELSDRGETVTLNSATGETLLSLTYGDSQANGWPQTADGHGDSLVLMDVMGDGSDPHSWQASSVVGGAPGASQLAGGLQASVLSQSGVTVPAPASQGTSAVQTTPGAELLQPTQLAGVRFGSDLLLAGYDVYLNGLPLAQDDLPDVQPGDMLEYVLYWRADALAGEDVHAFVQLATPDGQVLVQDDHPAGLVLRPANDCLSPDLAPDRYELRIPADAAPGLYQPLVGGYVLETAERFAVVSDAGDSLGDDYRLPPLKVVSGGPGPAPQHPVNAQFGEQIALLGYDLSPEVQPGAELTVTLYFRGQAPMEQDFTRFLQLYSPELGMAAQFDSTPANGRNPTWSWKPDEIVADRVVLTVAPEAAPGTYALMVGFYDPADSRRLNVTDETGQASPDRSLVLTTVAILAKSEDAPPASADPP